MRVVHALFVALAFTLFVLVLPVVLAAVLAWEAIRYRSTGAGEQLRR